MDQDLGTIRPGAETDAELVSGIIRGSFSDVAQRFGLTRENCPKHPSNCTPDWIRADLKRGVRYFILEQGRQPKGCVGLEIPEPRLGYLERLAVLPEDRNKGMGRSLALHVIHLAKAKGVRHLSIGIIGWQSGLMAWYGRLGFRQTQTKTFPHLPFPVTFMRLDTASCSPAPGFAET